MVTKEDCLFTNVDIILTDISGNRVVINAVPEEITYMTDKGNVYKSSITIKLKKPKVKNY